MFPWNKHQRTKRICTGVNPTKRWRNSSQRWPIRLHFKVNKIPWHIRLKKEASKRGDWRCRHLSYFFAFLYFVNALNCEKYIALYPFRVSLLSRVSLDGAFTTANSIYIKQEEGWRGVELKTRSKRSHPLTHKERIFGWKEIRTKERKKRFR